MSLKGPAKVPRWRGECSFFVSFADQTDTPEKREKEKPRYFHAESILERSRFGTEKLTIVLTRRKYYDGRRASGPRSARPFSRRRRWRWQTKMARLGRRPRHAALHTRQVYDEFRARTPNRLPKSARQRDTREFGRNDALGNAINYSTELSRDNSVGA